MHKLLKGHCNHGLNHAQRNWKIYLLTVNNLHEMMMIYKARVREIVSIYLKRQISDSKVQSTCFWSMEKY